MDVDGVEPERSRGRGSIIRKYYMRKNPSFHNRDKKLRSVLVLWSSIFLRLVNVDVWGEDLEHCKAYCCISLSVTMLLTSCMVVCTKTFIACSVDYWVKSTFRVLSIFPFRSCVCLLHASYIIATAEFIHFRVVYLLDELTILWL